MTAYSETLTMDTIFTAFWPFYCVTKTFGLFPMSFEGPARKGNLVQKYRDFVVPLLNVSIGIFMVPLIILYPMTVDNYSPLMTTLVRLVVIFGAVLILIPLAIQIHKRHSIKKFVLDLDCFDKKVTSCRHVFLNKYFILFHRRKL